jgi:phosphoserine aminotransferase
VSAINNKTITESAAQIETTRSYMDLSFSRAPKKNHDAMEQFGKPFVQRFKKHGVRSEIYHLSSNNSRAAVAEAAQQASRKRLLLLRA